MTKKEDDAVQVSSPKMESLSDNGAESATNSGDERKPAKRPVSDKKRAANRANAQKSTGPRSERGRQHSRRNAIKHGFFTTISIADLEKVPGYQQLQTILEELGRRYAPKTVAEQIRLEKAAFDLWRHTRAARAEMLIGDAWVGHVDGMPTVLRYVGLAERSLLKSLEALEGREERHRRDGGRGCRHGRRRTGSRSCVATTTWANGVKRPRAFEVPFVAGRGLGRHAPRSHAEDVGGGHRQSRTATAGRQALPMFTVRITGAAGSGQAQNLYIEESGSHHSSATGSAPAACRVGRVGSPLFGLVPAPECGWRRSLRDLGCQKPQEN
jgi:hypothetical protein